MGRAVNSKLNVSDDKQAMVSSDDLKFYMLKMHKKESCKSTNMEDALDNVQLMLFPSNLIL